MMDPEAHQNSKDTALAGLANFGGLDQLGWLIILLSVLVARLAKNHQLMPGAPGWFLDWAVPLLLIATGYWVRRKITKLLENPREIRRNDSEK